MLLVAVLFGREVLAPGAAELECAADLESLLFMWVRRVRGEGTQATVLGALTQGGRCLWDLSGALVWTIWSLWAPASTAGMWSFVLMLRFIAFKM